MTKFREPVWVGMDVDAELARYARGDQERAGARGGRAVKGASRRSLLGAGLRASLALTGKEALSPQSPLAA